MHNQAGQRIPGYFSSNGNCHYKTYENPAKPNLKNGSKHFRDLRS